ncbi:MAG: 50S ribosomal protein L17 [Bacteriovoracaceae bacterium]|jgi:large subunit ribosomal protein L17|nr:50S ribosomal protein L17 [Halobacteriovoraceae bacterium]MDP7321729.1 50S ribosomal protein L17 [Bacteriovoracaceae bacterium]|tara:strand:+ start:337 stop:693 length:357 start_codon:yes stop_codon:yes gene_type:complete
MRHAKHKYKLGVEPSHRKAMIRNLAVEVIDHGKIKTTQTRAKAVRGVVEKLVTLAKNDTVHNRRLALQKLNNKGAVNKLFTEIGPKFKERNGGYTRIVKLADKRLGDSSSMGYISFVE